MNKRNWIRLAVIAVLLVASSSWAIDLSKTEVMERLLDAEGAVENFHFSLVYQAGPPESSKHHANLPEGLRARAHATLEGLFTLDEKPRYKLISESRTPYEDGGHVSRKWSGSFDGDTVRETHYGPSGNPTEGIVRAEPLTWQIAPIYRALAFSTVWFCPVTKAPQHDGHGLTAFLREVEVSNSGSWEIAPDSTAELLRLLVRERSDGNMHVIDLDRTKGLNISRYEFIQGFGTPSAETISAAEIKLQHLEDVWLPGTIESTVYLSDSEGNSRFPAQITRFDMTYTAVNTKLTVSDFAHTFERGMLVHDEDSAIGRAWYDVKWQIENSPWLSSLPAVSLWILALATLVFLAVLWALRNRKERSSH